jgi:cytoskeletal protein RodZ
VFAALLGLLGLLCVGQGQTPQNQAPENQASENQASRDQSSQSPPASQGEPSSQNESSSKPKPSPTPLPKDPVPLNKAPQSPPSQKPGAQSQSAQNQSMITLDSSETIFSVLTALNACGYDQDLTTSDAARSNVRAEVQRNLRDSEAAEATRTALCEFYQSHLASKDPNRNLSQ